MATSATLSHTQRHSNQNPGGGGLVVLRSWNDRPVAKQRTTPPGRNTTHQDEEEETLIEIQRDGTFKSVPIRKDYCGQVHNKERQRNATANPTTTTGQCDLLTRGDSFNAYLMPSESEQYPLH